MAFVLAGCPPFPEHGRYRCANQSDCSSAERCLPEGVCCLLKTCAPGACGPLDDGCGGTLDCRTEGACETCLDARFTGASCTQCKDARFTGVMCADCANPRRQGPGCVDCQARFTGPQCELCSDDRRTGLSCDQCVERFSGPECAECSNPNTVAPGCVDCKPAFTGERCEQCVDPRLAGPNCTMASATHQSQLGIVWMTSAASSLDFTRSEITVGQYRACVSAGVCGSNVTSLGVVEESHPEWCNWEEAGREDHPMNCVDQSDAALFCEWVGGRLPTHDEWRAEASDQSRRTYPWGEESPTCERAVRSEPSGDHGAGCGELRTWAVCSKPAGDSVSGLCDMSGNVWEMMVPTEPDTTPTVRGGGFDGTTEDFHFRTDYVAQHSQQRAPNMGFRCVRD